MKTARPSLISKPGNEHYWRAPARWPGPLEGAFLALTGHRQKHYGDEVSGLALLLMSGVSTVCEPPYAGTRSA